MFDLNVFFDVRILAKQSLLNLHLNKKWSNICPTNTQPGKVKSLPCKTDEGFADNVETRSARSSLGATGAKAGGQIQGMLVKLKQNEKSFTLSFSTTVNISKISPRVS